MDIKEIKQIVDLMKRSSLTEFELEEKGFKLRISRRNEDATVVTQPAYPVAAQVAMPPAPSAPQPTAAEAAATKAEENAKLIKSPMVGTFYTAPSPDSAAFVSVGDSVKADSVVCIIEAMKVMNEIHAETAGTIAEILVSNGESVEFGQPLFRLK